MIERDESLQLYDLTLNFFDIFNIQRNNLEWTSYDDFGDMTDQIEYMQENCIHVGKLNVVVSRLADMSTNQERLEFLSSLVNVGYFNDSILKFVKLFTNIND
jgi:hypothetical protein